jgi:hypothetical protein
LLQLLQKHGDGSFAERIVGGKTEQYADTPHTLNLLRTCCQRPRDGRATKQSDEIAPPHLCPPKD